MSTRFFSSMAPVVKKFDYLVLGGGSGGLASARRAAEFGIKAAVIEEARWGGTCVCTADIKYCVFTIKMGNHIGYSLLKLDNIKKKFIQRCNVQVYFYSLLFLLGYRKENGQELLVQINGTLEYL